MSKNKKRAWRPQLPHRRREISPGDRDGKNNCRLSSRGNDRTPDALIDLTMDYHYWRSQGNEFRAERKSDMKSGGQRREK